MSLTTEVQALTVATTGLLTAVQASKAQIDSGVEAAQTARDEAVAAADLVEGVAALPGEVLAVVERLDNSTCYVAPEIIAHRGFGSLVAPDNAMSSYKLAVANGFLNIEQDVCMLSDGGLACIHGPTVDGTTNGTGDIAAFDSAAFKALDLDPANYLAAPAMQSEKPVLFDEVLKELGKTGCVFWPEAKASGVGNGVVASLLKHGIPKNRAVIQAFDFNELLPAIGAGYGAAYGVDPSTADFPTLRDSGVTHVFWSAWTEDQILAAKAAGIVTVIYTLNRRVDWEFAKSLGVQMVFTDDPQWVGRTLDPVKRDPFWSRQWPSGFLGNTSSRRGMWLTGGEWAYNGASDGIYRGVLQGWACPVKNDESANSFQIDLDLCLQSVSSATRFFGLFICATDDKDFQDSASLNNGYHLVVRQSGILDIYKKTGAIATKLATYAAPAFTLETFYKLRVLVTPTTITMSLPDTEGATVTLEDSEYRGGYFHFGQIGAYIRVKNVEIS